MFFSGIISLISISKATILHSTILTVRFSTSVLELNPYPFSLRKSEDTVNIRKYAVCLPE